MAVFIHVPLPGITTEQYDALNARLQEMPGIFDGCLSHVCARVGGGIEIFDLWESEEHMRAFGERMAPIAVEFGFPVDPSQPPATQAVHNYWTTGG
ncbi:hypothetical protein LG634_17190 [Streptomyces bambusae]|uniref:hypothetical protein n=1 Tax=Streptomyces bambusae TaxID=1550616 RepID=UPI001CFCB997|nr:hypothetical protein [Streptomyces bambusae]MCB5166565.1 hypothetical protein [Streptomyces bambusae]